MRLPTDREDKRQGLKKCGGDVGVDTVVNPFSVVTYGSVKKGVSERNHRV